MASNELEVGPAAPVEKIENDPAGRALNRRNLMAGLGIAGAAALGAGLVTRRSARRPGVVEAASFGTSFTQTDYLNFLLNIKYLQATFYSYVTQGTDLPAQYTVNSILYRPTFGTAFVNHPFPKIAFTGANAAQITDMLNEIYYDELNQLINLQNLIGPLGTVAITRPLIDILGTGTTIAAAGSPAAGTLTGSKALAEARLLEDLSVTAFAGVAGYLTGTNLTTATQIFAADGLHAGAIRLAIILQNTATPGTVVDLNSQSDIVPVVPGNFLNVQPDDVAPVDPGVATTSAAGPLATVSPASVATNFTASTTSGSNVLSVSSIAGLAPGYPIAGAGIPGGTTIVAISGTTVTISANATATATGVVITYTQPILANITFTGTTTSGSATITSASSITGLVAGYAIGGAGIPAGTTILSASGTTVTISANATATATAVTLTANTALQLTNCTAPIAPYTVNGTLYAACTAPQYQGFFATTGSGTASNSSPPASGFVLKRTPSQVLSVLFAASPGAAPAAPALPSTQVPPISSVITTGGFFPQGVNGQIAVAVDS
jgi:hypothetical protein